MMEKQDTMRYEIPRHAGAVKPRIIIHGGAGNVTPKAIPPPLYSQYHQALLTIINKTDAFMRNPKHQPLSALAIATYAVTLLEDCPLFNAGHGAVFTRDGINELEASVMVSRGYAKRGVGVAGLRHVRNPIRLAAAMLEHGDEDLAHARGPDVPSAQGHGLLFGETAEVLATQYGLEMVEPEYYFTQRRWDQHIRGLEREKNGDGVASWSADDFVPQGTVGAVALDAEGVLCVATSTGGITNKLTGRVGDTPSIGSGFWAEEWVDDEAAEVGNGDIFGGAWNALRASRTIIGVSDDLKGLLAGCLPTPSVYSPLGMRNLAERTTTRSVAISGTGNGDSFLRTDAARTVAAKARFGNMSSAVALRSIAGKDGELERSAGDRWGRTGEGEGGMIGIESVVIRNGRGVVVESRIEILKDLNCGGMFRAWIDDVGQPKVAIFRDE